MEKVTIFLNNFSPNLIEATIRNEVNKAKGQMQT